MSAEDIIEEIEKKGKDEINRVSADCEKSLKEIRDRSQERLKELEKNMSRKLEESLKKIEVTSKDEILIAIKTIEMERKRRLLEDFWEIAYNSESIIRKDPKYEEFIRNSIKEAGSKLGKGFKVLGSSEDKNIISKVNGDFTFEQSERIRLGILVTSSDGKRTLNMTFDSIMSDQKEKIEEMIMEKMGAD